MPLISQIYFPNTDGTVIEMKTKNLRLVLLALLIVTVLLSSFIMEQ